jgi:putative holliday junction resolvase
MRVIGLDLGTKRIGVATSDFSGTLASPFKTLQRSGSQKRDHQVIAALVVEEEAERVIVGLPLSMDGSMGDAAVRAQNEADALGRVVHVPVEMVDERLTTVTAQRSLLEMNVRRADRKHVVDQLAAAVLLQTWLDTQRAQRTPPEDHRDGASEFNG